jgi:hypothetical protein
VWVIFDFVTFISGIFFPVCLLTAESWSIIPFEVALHGDGFPFILTVQLTNEFGARCFSLFVVQSNDAIAVNLLHHNLSVWHPPFVLMFGYQYAAPALIFILRSAWHARSLPQPYQPSSMWWALFAQASPVILNGTLLAYPFWVVTGCETSGFAKPRQPCATTESYLFSAGKTSAQSDEQFCLTEVVWRCFLSASI